MNVLRPFKSELYELLDIPNEELMSKYILSKKLHKYLCYNNYYIVQNVNRIKVDDKIRKLLNMAGTDIRTEFTFNDYWYDLLTPIYKNYVIRL